MQSASPVRRRNLIGPERSSSPMNERCTGALYTCASVGAFVLLAGMTALAIASVFERVEGLGARPAKRDLLFPAARWFGDGLLALMGRDKKADAVALNMVMVAAPGDVRLRVNPARDRLVAAIEELRR